MQQILQSFQTFNWRTPSWDLFIFGAWILVSVIYAFAAGRGRVINILISTYIAELIVSKFGFVSSLPQKMSFSPGLVSFYQLIAFVAVFLILFLLLGRYVFRTSADSHKVSAMLFSVLFSFLQIGLLINIILSLLPDLTKQNFSPLSRALFIKDPASLIWLLLPLVYLVVLGKYISEDDEI